MTILNQELQKEHRIPPASEEAERDVLGSMLIDSVRVIELCAAKALSAEAFYVPAHRRLFDHILGMSQNERTINLLSVGEELKKTGRLDQVGGYAYLEGLINSTSTPDHAEFYIDIVLQKQLLRRMLAQAAETTAQCYEPEGEAAEILTRTTNAFFELSDIKVPEEEKWADVIDRETQRFMKSEHLENGVLTGFPDLDYGLKGFHAADMVVLAGHPCTGKTTLAMNIAENAALGRSEEKTHAVGIFSLELSQDVLARRLLFGRASVPPWKDYLSKSDQEKLCLAADQLKVAPLIVDDSVGLDIMDLRARARRMKKIYGIELLIIDYLQLLGDSRCSRDGRKMETASITRNIKAMAKELNIPVLVLVQLRLVPERVKPRLSDLRDVGSIEQNSDVVLLLQRPLYYCKDLEAAMEPGLDTLAIVDIAKHRRGATGEVKLDFFGEYPRFNHHERRAPLIEQTFKPKADPKPDPKPRKAKPKVGSGPDCLTLC